MTVGFWRVTSPTSPRVSECTRRQAGGVVVSSSYPGKPPLSWFFAVWFDRIVPGLGRVAGDPEAYSYLPASVQRFPGPRDLAAELAATGLTDVRWLVTAGGIVTIHVGRKP